MKIKFKQQPFQEEAVRSVADCFEGQPRDAFVYGNGDIMLTEPEVLANIREVQRRNGLKLSDKPDGAYHLTIEMETGTGKTYTYIKTMFELNRKYGWSKYIVVVPSIAIREGVLMTFRMTEDHFAEEYGRKARYFVYNSKRLHDLASFASDGALSVMIINSQAFSARGRDARRIYAELDELQSRRPIDVVAGTRPIVVIDEPQSVEGEKTKEALELFLPLLTLRYSATHRHDYDKIYRLDALDAYNRKLVKKIEVKGIAVRGASGTAGYLYVEGVEVSAGRAPAARIEYERRTETGIARTSRKLQAGDDLYELSGGMEPYRGYKIAEINGGNLTVQFVNGVYLRAGDVQGDANEEIVRRIQIRETIRSHLEKERKLFYRGIKVLSLFFIDEVAKYRRYEPDGRERGGEYARLFEEEYGLAVREAVGELRADEPYRTYLNGIAASSTHKGYFSVDKKSKRFVDPRLPGKDTDSDDAEAYDLIMKEKERLLSLAEPTRFLFSHSALKEGWDNPNVFQICTLKHNDSSIRKRQEVGRGLRLCVDRHGERMDGGVPGLEVHEVNVLTVIASESYESFAKALQSEIAALSERPQTDDGPDSGMVSDARRSRRGEPEEPGRPISRNSEQPVVFDTDELVRSCVEGLDGSLVLPCAAIVLEYGGMERIESKAQLQRGEAFAVRRTEEKSLEGTPAAPVRYDLIGRLAMETRLTRRTIVRILTGVRPETFGQFKRNPEQFILRAARIINERKAAIGGRNE